MNRFKNNISVLMEDKSVFSGENYILAESYYPPLSVNSSRQSENFNLRLFSIPLINNNFEMLLQKKRKNKQGRKKKNSTEKGKHNKYSSDNLIRKCKVTIINILNELINRKIKEFYNNDISNKLRNEKLMKMNQEQIVNSNVKFNKSFLNKTLKEIFSQNLSSKCKRYNIDHNLKLIKELLNEKDKIKRQFFNDIFNLTFLECVEHFRGTKYFGCLEGLKSYEEICQNIKGDDNYKETFKAYIDNYEQMIEQKRSRKPATKKDMIFGEKI